MKIFTHSYKITFFQNGKFCWKNHGWVKNNTDGVFVGVQQMLLIGVIFIAVQALANSC